MSSISVGYDGMQRATRLVIDKKVGGESLAGYPKVYDFLDTFGNFIAITCQQLSTLSVSAYRNRLAGFKTYIETIETGVTIDITGAYKEDYSACPLN